MSILGGVYVITNRSSLSTPQQVAEHFGVSVTTVNSWVRAGRIPCVRPSRRVVRFDLDAVEQAIARPVKDSGQRSKGLDLASEELPS